MPKKLKPTSRQHVLAFLDKAGSSGRRLADEYRKLNGLKVKDRCIYCGTEGHSFSCPESDRVGFACSNFTQQDKLRHEAAIRKQHQERRR